MKTYLLSVVTSEAETYTCINKAKTKKEANYFLDGMCYILEKQGKSIFIKNIKLK